MCLPPTHCLITVHCDVLLFIIPLVAIYSSPDKFLVVEWFQPVTDKFYQLILLCAAAFIWNVLCRDCKGFLVTIPSLAAGAPIFIVSLLGIFLA